MSWLAILIGCGTPDIPKSEPTKPTVEMKSSSVSFPADSPLAPLFPKGKPSMPVGQLAQIRLGMPESEARSIRLAIAGPEKHPEEARPREDTVGFGGDLPGFDQVGFVILASGGVVVALDLTVPLEEANGVLEMAWGDAENSHLPNGAPSGVWRNPDQNLKVTFANVGGGKAVIAFEPLAGAGR
jgi:hypothetical protein